MQHTAYVTFKVQTLIMLTDFYRLIMRTAIVLLQYFQTITHTSQIRVTLYLTIYAMRKASCCFESLTICQFFNEMGELNIRETK